jgi:hypothetical protein
LPTDVAITSCAIDFFSGGARNAAGGAVGADITILNIFFLTVMAAPLGL